MKTILRVVLLAIFAAAVALAVLSPPQKFFPAISVDVNDPSGAVSLQFLFEPQASLADCEAIHGRITRDVVGQCPQCRVKALSCDTTLGTEAQAWLGSQPLEQASGRMPNGVVLYQSAVPGLAANVCAAAQAQTMGAVSPVQCYAAGQVRAQVPAKPVSLSLAALVSVFALLVSGLAGWLIVRYEHLHAHFSHDHADSGPQKYHTTPTPRIGGIAVMAGLMGAGGAMLMLDSLRTERLFGLLLLSAMPAFWGGLIEDLTKRVGVMERLLMTMLSGAVAAWLMGAVLQRLDIPVLDQALLWLPFAVVLTAFAVGGIANSINIIDGYNGLAGGFAVVVLASMAYVAHRVGDDLVLTGALALMGAILGFLVWNWPHGRIFFGDGGAYLVGFMLAELSVLLVLRNPGVSPWYPLLLLVYPIFETLYSAYRRQFVKKLSAGQPDNEHLHQLIHDKWLPRVAGESAKGRNSRVAKYIWAAALMIGTSAAVAFGQTSVLVVASLLVCVLYVLGYGGLVRRK